MNLNELIKDLDKNLTIKEYKRKYNLYNLWKKYK